MDTDTFRRQTHIAANLNAPYIVISPPEFQTHLREIARQIHGAMPYRQERKPSRAAQPKRFSGEEPPEDKSE